MLFLLPKAFFLLIFITLNIGRHLLNNSPEYLVERQGLSHVEVFRILIAESGGTIVITLFPIVVMLSVMKPIVKKWGVKLFCLFPVLALVSLPAAGFVLFFVYPQNLSSELAFSLVGFYVLFFAIPLITLNFLTNVLSGFIFFKRLRSGQMVVDLTQTGEQD